MFRKTVSCSFTLAIVAILVMATPKIGHARGRGGGHFGGVRNGSFHGGYRSNAHLRGRAYYPFYGLDYGYHYDAGAYSYVAPSPTAYPNSGASVGLTDPTRFSTFTFTPPAGSMTAVYPPAATGAVQASRSAAITVKAPTNSKIWFDGTLMAAGGTVRQYFSPPLAPGHKYVYEIQARWNRNGREVTQSKRVEVSSGAQVSVDFPIQTESAG
jgi:uncharacterized protein (TIGR03000 family)